MASNIPAWQLFDRRDALNFTVLPKYPISLDDEHIIDGDQS